MSNAFHQMTGGQETLTFKELKKLYMQITVSVRESDNEQVFQQVDEDIKDGDIVSYAKFIRQICSGMYSDQ